MGQTLSSAEAYFSLLCALGKFCKCLNKEIFNPVLQDRSFAPWTTEVNGYGQHAFPWFSGRKNQLYVAVIPGCCAGILLET